ncbi:hypothetical protein DK419_26740 [Methylobacterium terrae]|uniref:Uncharacterized protein n=1 Tax=Methylobacterium terrae TaxID=2202827 RepID=A0A2U8WVQ6_9HYPH|nr:hypothetical protein [Methylobacterium terrae]AWN49491.1 hypothetical protein DK419_26740 [Methylobacterium terrae]
MKASRKIAATPSLRERAAALSAKASQVLRPGPITDEPDLGRRALVVGSLAAGAALPLPALAAPASAPGSHPDHELFEAEAAMRTARLDARAASDAAVAATEAFYKARGRPPVELMMNYREEHLFASLPRCPGVGFVPTYMVHRPPGPDGRWRNPGHAWTERGLQHVIARAVDVFGRGGQTPHRIRRWKGLLPTAAEFDAHHERLREHFRLADLGAARDAADGKVVLAVARFEALVAGTIDGLAVKVRYAGRTSWEQMPKCWSTLLQSAAAVSGVALASRSDFEA